MKHIMRIFMFSCLILLAALLACGLFGLIILITGSSIYVDIIGIFLIVIGFGIYLNWLYCREN